ncbi:SDR family oxidoreductase [Dasania marina]|uniref:SDR family oxidoreductase n=1 Tax=Dasania marina TaxID=471499 RepID=UPI0030DB1C3F|tara:strand:- start:86453 stop:87214 length:762 start_codon:yes stop_codon:yes gene_type:complete
MNINNNVIAITGGGQGLGRSMATLLASKGARLALIDLNQEKLDETVQLCKAAGGDAKAYICNVANEENVVATFQAIASDFGQLDGLINNAGILRDGMLIKARDGKVEKKMSLAEWQSVIDVNLTGVFLCGREAAEQMITTNSKGVIINISSISRAGNVGQTNYSAAKAGVAAMTVTWAKELARYGIRSAGVAPGFIATDMVASMKPEAIEKFTSVIPARRLGTPQEIAETCLYILETDYVNGRIIEMDGGLRL